MPYAVLDRDAAQAAPDTTVGEPREENGLTLAQLDEELRLSLLGRTDILEPRRLRYINLAYTDMVTSLKIPEMKASIELPLVEEEFLYLLPPAVFAVVHLSALDPTVGTANSGYPLELTDEVAFRARPLKTDPPEEYFRLQDMIGVWPTPRASAIAVLEFWIRPTWLTLPTHCPILNVEWSEGLILLATHKLLRASQEWEAAMVMQNEYLSFVRKRLDSSAVEDEGKVMRSSAPKNLTDLRRSRLPHQDDV